MTATNPNLIALCKEMAQAEHDGMKMPELCTNYGFSASKTRCHCRIGAIPQTTLEQLERIRLEGKPLTFTALIRLCSLRLNRLGKPLRGSHHKAADGIIDFSALEEVVKVLEAGQLKTNKELFDYIEKVLKTYTDTIGAKLDQKQKDELDDYRRMLDKNYKKKTDELQKQKDELEEQFRKKRIELERRDQLHVSDMVTAIIEHTAGSERLSYLLANELFERLSPEQKTRILTGIMPTVTALGVLHKRLTNTDGSNGSQSTEKIEIGG